MKKKILIVLTLLLLLCQLSACNTTQRVISNVSQRKIDFNPHVAAWLAKDRSNELKGKDDFIFVYKNFLDGRNIYKVVLLRQNAENQANVKLEFVEEETRITVKIHVSDKKASAEDGRTVSYIEFKANSKKEVFFKVVDGVESDPLLNYTDVNIAM